MSKYYLCVTPFFPSPSVWQGAYILDQVKALRRISDYEVIVFKTCPLNQKPSDYMIDGIKVNEIRPLLMPSYFLNGLTEDIVGDSFVRELGRRGINPADIKYVHCHTVNHSAFGFGVKRVNPKVKVLVQFHDLDPLNLRNGFWADKKWNRRFRAKKSVSALNKADLLVCISKHVRDVIMSFPHPRKGEVYKSALKMYDDISDIKPASPRQLYILNNGVDTRIFNGRFY